jgi:hypothetical protein
MDFGAMIFPGTAIVMAFACSWVRALELWRLLDKEQSWILRVAISDISEFLVLLWFVST